jgi:hypothetical protein
MVRTARGNVARCYVLQRINRRVFRDPVLLMENIRRVTGHLRTKLPKDQQTLALVATVDKEFFCVDGDGEYWRVFHCIEGARTIDRAESAGQVREAAAIFGRFQSLLCDLPPPLLHETIPGFHDTPARYGQFRVALRQDAHNRARECGAEIDQALAFENAAGVIASLQAAGDLPSRIVHNDTKLNNVMFDAHRDVALCVIDLDTVMQGLALHDFGDLVRSATASAEEGETDLARIRMRLDYFEALAEGYLSTAMAFLTEVEIGHLAVAGKILTIETGLRFLTDYLSGDIYFRVHRPQHNLERCRSQFALAASIDAQLGEMQEIVRRLASGLRSEQLVAME